MYDIKAFPQDPSYQKKRTEYANNIRDIKLESLFKNAARTRYRFKELLQELPETEEELEIHMQLNYKQVY